MRVWMAMAGMALTTVALPAAAQDAAAGKTQFQSTCGICHATVAGKNGLGPSLFGVVGRVSGTAPGFNYSQAMKNAKIKWDKAELDSYLAAPAKKVPGNRMAYAGQPDAAKRAQLVAYLATLK